MIEIVPSRHRNRSIVDQLCQFIRSFDGMWLDGIAGMTDEQMNELVRMTRVVAPYPEEYVHWMKIAGVCDGGLLRDSMNIVCSFASIAELYSDFVRFDRDSINPELPVVACKVIGSEVSLDLRGESSSEAEIRHTADGEDLAYFSESWSHLLFQAAASRYCKHAPGVDSRSAGVLPDMYRSSVADRDVDLVKNRVETLLIDEGLELLWFSDRRHLYAADDELLTMVDINRSGGAVATVASRDAAVLGGRGARLLGGLSSLTGSQGE